MTVTSSASAEATTRARLSAAADASRLRMRAQVPSSPHVACFCGCPARKHRYSFDLQLGTEVRGRCHSCPCTRFFEWSCPCVVQNPDTAFCSRRTWQEAIDHATHRAVASGRRQSIARYLLGRSCMVWSITMLREEVGHR